MSATSNGRSSRNRGKVQASTWVFYVVQGQAGESSAHPNVFRVPKHVKEIRLADIQQNFPLSQATGARFHFRFKVEAGGDVSGKRSGKSRGSRGTYCYMDLVNPADTVPTFDNHVHVKALQLDTLRCVAQRTNRFLRRRVPANGAQAAASHARGAQQAPQGQEAHRRPGPPRRSNTLELGELRSRARQASRGAANGGNAAAPPNAPQRSAPTSTAPAAPKLPARAASTGGQPSQSPLMPVPEHPVDTAAVEMPEHIDEDLRNSGKSDFVIAGIQKRRDELAARNAARLQAIRDREEAAKRQEAQRHDAQQELGKKLDAWRLGSNGQPNNIRVLLCTLDQVLWEGAKWKPVKMGELVNDRKVHIKYLRACTVVHPDKNQNAEFHQRYISERVFEALNEAKKK